MSYRVCLDKIYFAETENWKHCSKIIFKCVNSTVGPIFNEKINKNEICGSVNSARMHSSRKTGQKLRLLFMYRQLGEKAWKKEKKKKGKRRNLKRSKRRSKLCHSHCWIKVSPRYEDKSWSWQSNPVLHDNQTLYYMTPWKTLYYMTPWKCYWPIYFIDNNRTTPSKDWHVCSNDFSNDLKKKIY